MALLASIGLTEIHLSCGHAVITHSGNMGNSIETVKYNLDSLFGKGTFDRLRACGEETGSPDYWYELRIPNEDFTRITRKDHETNQLQNDSTTQPSISSNLLD